MFTNVLPRRLRASTDKSVMPPSRLLKGGLRGGILSFALMVKRQPCEERWGMVS
jgi:hypothetical protein